MKKCRATLPSRFMIFLTRFLEYNNTEDFMASCSAISPKEDHGSGQDSRWHTYIYISRHLVHNEAGNHRTNKTCRDIEDSIKYPNYILISIPLMHTYARGGAEKFQTKGERRSISQSPHSDQYTPICS